MEKRVLAAIALSVVVLFFFRYLEEKRLSETGGLRPTAQRQTPSAPAPAAAKLPSAPVPAEKAAPSGTPQRGDTVATEQSLIIDGAFYRAVLENRGALITSWRLHDYLSAGEEFEMIGNNHFPEDRPYPGSLILGEAALTHAANNEPYEISIEKGGMRGDSYSPPLTVTMRLVRGDLQISKTYKFEKDNYTVDLSASVDRGGSPFPARFLLGQDIGPEREHLVNTTFTLSAVSSRGGKVKRESPPKEEGQAERIEGDIRWVGLDMHYFALIAIPSQPLAEFEIQRIPVITEGLDKEEVKRDLLRLSIPSSGSSQYELYLGPKKQDALKAARGADLSGVIDYGMFWFLVRPLIVSLKWIQNYANNWGVAIILLTLVLTILLFPIRLKQMLSMKKMQAVQPKVKAIQEKYKRYKKTDPKRAEMNREVMALYKEHNVNPLGGCFPLLLQMPLLFAFYSLLNTSIELRQAPFLGWIVDLAQKDPYYVLPIVMGITMLISQKMTPMTPGSDPTQAKMMMMMPVIFTIFFLNVSAGLNLYFLCSNVFQISFQKIAERWLGDGRKARKARA